MAELACASRLWGSGWVCCWDESYFAFGLSAQVDVGGCRGRLA